MNDTRRMVIWGVGAAVLCLVLVVVAQLASDRVHGPVSTNKGAEGTWLLADYLEARGHPVHRWRHPTEDLDQVEGRGPFVLQIRAASRYTRDDATALRRWMLTGGSAVLLVHGEGESSLSLPFLRAFDLEFKSSNSSKGPLSELWEDPLRHAQASHAPDSTWAPTPDLVFSRPLARLHRPMGGQAPLYVDAEGEPFVWAEDAVGRQVVVVQAGDLWSNGWIDEGGNLAFLDELVAQMGGDQGVWLDEWHQGLVATVPTEADTQGRRTLWLILAHAALVYIGVVWAVGRRFGAVRPEVPAVISAVDRDLRLLGRLHERGAHWDQAGELLLRTARTLARSRPDTLAALPTSPPMTAAEVVSLARTVAGLQSQHRL